MTTSTLRGSYRPMWSSSTPRLGCIILLVLCGMVSSLPSSTSTRRGQSSPGWLPNSPFNPSSLILPGLTNSVPQVGRVTAGPIDMSELGCGTWSWGNRFLWDYDPADDENIYQAYREVRAAGVTLYDSADSYGTFDLNGRAEILLGQFERRYQEEITATRSKSPWSALSSSFSRDPTSTRRQAQQVATKLAPYPWRVTRQSVVGAARASLRRLGQERIAMFQLHWSTANYQPLQEGALWDGLADIYDQGWCDAVAVSNYGPQQLLKIAKHLQKREVPLAAAQIQYSLMTYQVAQQMNEACDEVGCRIIAYSPLCLGLLTGKYNLDRLPRPGNPRRALFRELLPGAQPLLQLLDAVAKEYNKTPSQVAINWALCHDTVPIPGCRTIDQAKGNLGSVGWRLKGDAMEELDRMALQLKKPMIQNIFQTK